MVDQKCRCCQVDGAGADSRDGEPFVSENVLMDPLGSSDNIQGSHRHWKTWKNETTFSSQGKVREFWKNIKKSGKSQGILSESGKSQGKLEIHKLKFNQWRIKILLNFSHKNYSKIPFFG